MANTAIVGRNVEVVQTSGAMSAFSWGAAAAGAVAATAIAFILISLGTGVGMLAASPYSSGPSLTTLTVVGAAWIVLSQTWGFTVGGYLAGRLRTFANADNPDEADFRDGAHGLVAWAIGVLLTLVMVASAGMFAVGLTGHVASTVGAGAAAGAAQSGTADTNGYFTDMLFRSPQPRPDAAAQQGGSAANATDPANAQARAEAGRIIASGLASGSLTDDDRAYLGRLVSARTGMTQEEATRRVADVEARVKANAKDAADKAAKAASMFSFWTFMSLLMGAVAAVVGGIVGGNHRDENIGVRRVR